MNDDTISRRAAIDRINKQREHLRPDIYEQDYIGDAAYRICAEFIERLPSAQPKIEERTEEFAQNVPKEDLISRKAAIDAMGKAQWAKERLMELPSAQPETHEERTETHACDLISRQAAIDAILAVTGNSSVRELYEHVQEHGLSEMWSGGVNAAIDIIIAVPSAQPEVLACGEGELSAQPERTGRWIPCSERLPDSKEYVLVTDHGETNIGRRFCYRWWLDYCGDKMNDVIAWKPLPEPYREEENETD